jgi:hypothetical protein
MSWFHEKCCIYSRSEALQMSVNCSSVLTRTLTVYRKHLLLILHNVAEPKMWIVVLWVMTLCGLLGGYELSGVTYYLHLRGINELSSTTRGLR